MSRTCGFAAIIGAPNVGKSTLVNTLVGEKVSIVTHKAQTTRMAIRGIMMDGDSQIVLVDTPGLFQAKKRFEKAMVAAIHQTLAETDVVIHMIDALKGIQETDQQIQKLLKDSRKPSAVVVNKVDAIAAKPQLLPMMKALADSSLYAEIFPLSAQSGDGVAPLRKFLASAMPEGPWLFDAEQLSDLPQQLMAAEVVREKLMLYVHDEIPYDLIVVPQEWELFNNGSVKIRQNILVARDSQKQIVLGKGGSKIKQIRVEAQQDLQNMLEKPVHLFLDVKVDAKWMDRAALYQGIGLNFGEG